MATKKRQRRKPVPILPADAAGPYQREWTAGELYDLLHDLAQYAQEMPPQLWDRVRWLIMGQIVKKGISMKDIHSMRWIAACESIERVGWDAAFEDASERLVDTPAAGGPDTIEASYKSIQNTLPPELRRKRQRR